MSNKTQYEGKIVIEGITKEGQKFRPSDWAERVSGQLATYRDQRIHYSPLLQPGMHHQGHKCIVIDPELKISNHRLYESLIAFAKRNALIICDEFGCREPE